MSSSKSVSKIEADEYRDLLAVLTWSCKAINRYWRLIYSNGIWLTRSQAWQLVQDGWAFSEPQRF